MEVLILSPFFSPNIGGVETHLDDLVEILNEKKIKGYVVTYQPLMSDIKALKKEMRGAVEIHRIEWFRKLFYIVEPYPLLDFLYLTPRLLLATIFFLLTHKKVTVIHAQGINAACIAILVNYIFRKRVVISTHAVYEFSGESLFSKITRWIFNKADKVLALLEHSKKELIKLGVKEKRITAYTYWIDQEKFKPADKSEAKKEVNWLVDYTHVLFVGRLIEKKGVREVIKAASLIGETEKIVFHIIGTGDLENEVRNANTATSLDYIGKILNKDLPAYFQAADMFIIPSTHEEGAGRVVMEALSCGTPVLGSNRGGIPEILKSEVGGLFEVSPENIIKAVRSVQERINNKELTTVQCRKYAEQNFSKQNAQQIIDSYSSEKL